MIQLREISTRELIHGLAKKGYTIARQKGSHLQLTTSRNGDHRITVRQQEPLAIATVTALLDDVARHFRITPAELLKEIF